MVYVTPDWLAQTPVGPLMVPTVPTAAVGSTVIEVQLPKLVPQAFPAVTQMVPEELPKSIVGNRVPCPAATVAPAGTVQV